MTQIAYLETPWIRDQYRGLVSKVNAANPTYQADIDVDELILQNEDGVCIRVPSVNLTVDITASGANGLDTGSEANSTWYYEWVIFNPTTEVTAGLLSTSSTFPGGLGNSSSTSRLAGCCVRSRRRRRRHCHRPW